MADEQAEAKSGGRRGIQIFWGRSGVEIPLTRAFALAAAKKGIPRSELDKVRVRKGVRTQPNLTKVVSAVARAWRNEKVDILDEEGREILRPKVDENTGRIIGDRVRVFSRENWKRYRLRVR